MIAEAVDREWDVIVIGTGIGGGTIGRRLAEMGMSVLFLEKGPLGPRAEQQFLRTDVSDADARRARGYWPKPLNATIDGRHSLFFGAIGAGVGGSSSYYAAALERPERHDLETIAGRPHPTGGWPVSYDAFASYFAQAEAMYEVCGATDPLAAEDDVSLLPPPPMAPGDQAMMAGLKRSGLHPYQVHMGVRFTPGCRMCFGHKCPRICKMDARSAGVEPALRTGNAHLLDDCEVEALCEDEGTITHVEARRGGEILRLRARTYVLAAGGLGSPRLLLGSRSERWPDGLANRSGLVGRNLMFHSTEMIAIWPERGVRFEGPTKSLAMRDFYFADGQRFGALQAMGTDASYGEIVHYLKNIFDRSALRNIKPLRELTRIPAFLASKLFGNAKVFAGIIEDMPYEENRVLLDEEDKGRLKFEYTIPNEFHARRRQYRRLVKRRLRGHRSVFLTFQPELNFAHCCGTLRFGDDPRRSVLDADCRAHDLSNLYVADASFMPTSLGINPSLTIAANALRVAERICQRMKRRAFVPAAFRSEEHGRAADRVS